MNLVQLEISVGDEGSAVRRLGAGVGLPRFPHRVLGFARNSLTRDPHLTSKVTPGGAQAPRSGL